MLDDGLPYRVIIDELGEAGRQARQRFAEHGGGLGEQTSAALR